MPRCHNCGMEITTLLQEWGGNCPKDPKGHYIPRTEHGRFLDVQERMKELRHGTT